MTTTRPGGNARQPRAQPMAGDEVKLLRVFRRCRFRGNSDLTLFEHEIDGSMDDWEILGRPHQAAVDFFSTILPEKTVEGEMMPLHLFKANVWHAVWIHAHASQRSKLPMCVELFRDY